MENGHVETTLGQAGQGPPANGSGGLVGAGGGSVEIISSEPLPPPPAMILFLSACFAELRAKGM